MKKLTVFLGLLGAFSGPVIAKAVFMDPSSIKFTEVPGVKGVYSAPVEGDTAKGPHHTFMKFDPGFASPLHFHTANHFATVISGTMILTADGKEHKLPAGSYFSFTGKSPHETKCDLGAECVIFVDARGKWDVVRKVDKTATTKKEIQH